MVAGRGVCVSVCKSNGDSSRLCVQTRGTRELLAAGKNGVVKERAKDLAECGQGLGLGPCLKICLLSL